MTKNLRAASIFGSLVFGYACTALGQQTVPAATATLHYGAPVTLDEARKVAAAVREYAQREGWAMAISVVDNDGELVYFEKMDDTMTGSIEVSLGKARTAAQFKRPTKSFSDPLAAGASFLLTMRDVVAVPGGLPLMSHGKMVGALGVSGGTVAQDSATADAGGKVDID